MNPKGKNKDELVESIANEILNYMELHPNSVDSIDGIAKWWLKRQRYEEALNNVQLAVGLLLAEGKMKKTIINEGRVIYSARILSEIEESNTDRCSVRGRSVPDNPDSS